MDGRARANGAEMTIAFYLNRALRDGLPRAQVQLNDRPHEISELVESPTPPRAAEAYSRALEETASVLKDTYGTIRKAWGEIHVFVTPDGLIPAPGGCDELQAVFLSFKGWMGEGDEIDEDGIQRCNFASRTLRLYEVSREAIRVQSVTVTGQGPACEHQGSPHNEDQARLYSDLRLKQLPLTFDEVKAASCPSDHTRCNHRALETIVRPLRSYWGSDSRP